MMVVGRGYGGLEHRESTALLVSRKNLPMPGVSDTARLADKSYIEFLGLCSHEYFHCWNVKRIKPAVFVPYELNRETHTELLWAFEGITSYYDDLILARTGLISQESYLELLGQTISRVYRGSGRHRQSVAESSFDAWTRFYKQDENAPNAIVSYYAKGALVAFCLDMLIREKSNGRHSLDDLMRTLWGRWLENEQGVVQSDFQTIAADLCGTSVDSFFEAAVFGSDDLDLDSACKTAGIDLHWRSLASSTDRGGTETSVDRDARERLTFGVTGSTEQGGIKIGQVFDKSAAQRCGLASGDVVVAVDRLRVDAKADATELDQMLERHSAGDEVVVHAFRHGELHEFKLVCELTEKTACWLSIANTESGVMAGWLQDSDADPEVRHDKN